jgi:hypothetical protein
MTLGQLVFWYATILCVLLAVLIYMLLKRKRDGKSKSAETTTRRLTLPHIEWKLLLAYRPHEILTGEMWLRVLVAALAALSCGVIIVVFVFPLGAVWAAAASFFAIVLLAGVLWTLIE